MTRRGDMSQLSERDRGARRSEPAQLRDRGGAAKPKPSTSTSASTSTKPSPSQSTSTKPAGPQSTGDIAKNLQQSLASTDAGLKHFLAALRDSGMAASVSGYREMQMVLLQQRLWAHEQRRPELLPLFQSIARTAGELHSIFAGFTSVMQPLKELDKINRMSGLAPEPSAAAPAAATPAAPDEAVPAEAPVAPSEES